MDNTDLITKARELCDAAKAAKERGSIVDSAALSWAITQNSVPQLCDALEAAEKELIDYYHTQKVVDGKTAENARLRKINEQLTARAEKAEEGNKWVSVSERLPEKTGKYLVFYHEWSDGAFLPTYEDFTIRAMRFLDSKKWCYPVCVDKRCEADTRRAVTHWRLLPEPPKGDRA